LENTMMFGSRTLQSLIVRFVLWPDAAPHFRELQRATGSGVRSLQAALERLHARGLVRSEGQGNRRVVRVNGDHSGWDALLRMVRAFVEPDEVLREALSGIPGIRAAFVFGSVARREAHDESDVDLFVVGDEIPSQELARSVSESTSVLGREVNVVRYTPQELARRAAAGDPFVRSVVKAPKLWVVGDERLVAELTA
jgi:predicted nucleotidyltransferase